MLSCHIYEGKEQIGETVKFRKEQNFDSVPLMLLKLITNWIDILPIDKALVTIGHTRKEV